MRILIALSLVVLAAAPAASADRTKDVRALAAATAGRIRGEPMSCLQRSRTDNDFQAAGRHLIFRVSPRLTYVNELTPGCEVGGPRQAYVFRSPASRSCEGDIVQSVDPLGGAAGGGVFAGQVHPLHAALMERLSGPALAGALLIAEDCDSLAGRSVRAIAAA